MEQEGFGYQPDRGWRSTLRRASWRSKVQSRVMYLVSGRANVRTRSDSGSKVCTVPPLELMNFLKVLNSLRLNGLTTSLHLTLSSSFLADKILKDTVPFISKAPAL